MSTARLATITAMALGMSTTPTRTGPRTARKLPHDAATVRRRKKNKAARKSRRRNRR